MFCFMTLIKYEASIKLLTTTPVYELLQSALTISTCQKDNKTDPQKEELCLLLFFDRDGRPFVLSNDGRKIPATLSLLSAIMHKKFFVVLFSPSYW